MSETQVDPDTGARYTRLREGVAVRTLWVTDDVLVDLDADGRPLGIEDLSDLHPPPPEETPP